MVQSFHRVMVNTKYYIFMALSFLVLFIFSGVALSIILGVGRVLFG